MPEPGVALRARVTQAALMAATNARQFAGAKLSLGPSGSLLSRTRTPCGQVAASTQPPLLLREDLRNGSATATQLPLEKLKELLTHFMADHSFTPAQDVN